MPTTADSAAPAKDLHLSVRSASFRAAFRPAGSLRLSRPERAAAVAEIESARLRAVSGDDVDFRRLSLDRYAAECIVETGQNTGVARKRKFSNPLFLTPDGLLNAFPEKDEDLFATAEVAVDAVKRHSLDGHWEVRRTTLGTELRTKPYLRWTREVKGVNYQEPRRTDAELIIVYENGGRDALRKLYSKAHAFKIEKRLKAAQAKT